MWSLACTVCLVWAAVAVADAASLVYDADAAHQRRPVDNTVDDADVVDEPFGRRRTKGTPPRPPIQPQVHCNTADGMLLL